MSSVRALTHRWKRTGEVFSPRRPIPLARLSVLDTLRLRLGTKGRPLEIRLAGTRVLVTDPYWHLHSIREIFYEQAYRFEAESQAPRIVDCGANIGLSALYFLIVYPGASIVALEADPFVFQLLKRNISRFGNGQVDLHELAAWERDGNAGFVSDKSVGGRLAALGGTPSSSAVRTARLSTFLSRETDLLKLDIEGAELAVLRECRHALQNVRNIIFEYHGVQGEPQELDQVLTLVSEAGFRYHLKEANPVVHPLVQADRTRNRRFDLQLMVYCHRVHDGQ